MKIAARIMYHPLRPAPRALIHEIAQLDPIPKPEPQLEALEDGDCGQVMVMPDHESKGAWWNARRSWLSGANEPGATHVLVVHDDAVPSPRVAEHLRRAVNAVPDRIVSFYSSQPQFIEGIDLAKAYGARWVATATGCCGLANLMPVDLARYFVAWCDKMIRPDWTADDTRIALFAAAHGSPIWISAPNLFQHPPDGKGIDGGANKSTPWFYRSDVPIEWSNRFVEMPGDMKMYLRARSSKFVQGAK